jgi:ABC-type nitrate/sulfonate/bicarbonate transport system substrate-binding protein
MYRKLKFVLVAANVTFAALMIAAGGPAAAQGKKVVLAVPGIPPIFASVIAYVADKQGLFKKYGADVEVRPFETGTAAARAVLAGSIEMALSPTPPVINQISNANADIVGIFGFANPDWILASVDPTKTKCTDIKGQPVGVDSIGGARSTALRSMLIGCPGVKLDDVQQVALSSNVTPAMVAGRLPFGVLHLDDLAVIESQGKKMTILLEMKKTNPTSHYLLAVVRRDKLKENRDAYVRTLAGLIAAARFMQDPANADKVAADAAPTGHNPAISKAALKQFLAIGFWADKTDGLDRKKLDAVAKLMKKVGAIRADKEPVTYDRLVDPSLWRDANAMVK